jgi:hypothetical protein
MTDDRIGSRPVEQCHQCGHLVGFDEPLHRHRVEHDLFDDGVLIGAMGGGLVSDITRKIRRYAGQVVNAGYKNVNEWISIEVAGLGG